MSGYAVVSIHTLVMSVTSASLYGEWKTKGFNSHARDERDVCGVDAGDGEMEFQFTRS